MSKPLESEFRYFLEHQDELVEKYRGKVVVIVGEEVVGTYDDEAQAFKETQKSREVGTFLIQKCEPGEEAYTQVFHSRVLI